MALFLTIVVIVYLAWRYRRVLGLDKRWDGFGRQQASDLAASLGWGTRREPTAQPPAPARQPQTSRPARQGMFPKIDSRRLPVTIAAGIVEAIVVIGLDLAGHSLLSFLAAAVIGPFLGGLYVRSLWWPLIAALVAIVVGAGGEMSPLVVTVPVAIFGYVGARSDVAGWFSRLFAEPEDRSPHA
ncbi:MAG TPA: hypothetical protein VH482_33110 [Thermomicrobiales bacterium]